MSDRLPARQQFVENLASVFTVRTAAGAIVPLELAEVQQGRAAPGFEQFSVLFRGPREPLLPQMTYPMAHPALGEFALFIVPVSGGEAGFVYEAVFSTKLPGS